MEGQSGRKQPGAAHRSSHDSLFPRWSPDGTQILFTQIGADAHSRSYIVPSQGGTPGSFSRKRRGERAMRTGPPTDARSFFLCAISGSNRFFELRPAGSRPWQPSDHHTPRVEGHLFASMVAQRPLHRRGPIMARGGLKVFDFETQRWSVLPEKGECHYPTWSSNSQFIYFLRPAGDEPGVFRVRVSNGVEERVVDLKGFRSTGASGGWFGLDPRRHADVDSRRGNG